MRYLNLLLTAAACSAPSLLLGAPRVAVENSAMKVIDIAPEANTGLNNIFVVYNTDGCFLKASVSNGYTTHAYRYSNLGGGYAEELTDIERSASEIEFSLSPDDMGYIIEDGTDRYYCWIVNYANHFMTLQSVSVDPEPDCSYSVLNIVGDASPITFYTINGQPRVLSREISVEFTSQEFDKEAKDFVNVDISKIYESLSSVLSITPPALCGTYFYVSGDRFLKEWGLEVSAESSLASPYAVESFTEAEQDTYSGEEGSNVMKGDDSGLGGSAPADISFYAYTSEAVLHYEWQLSRDQNFDNLEYRFYQKDLDYTFTEEGTFYVRFIGSNADGSCETFGDTFTVSIGASALECPNAFSPNDDGVNDIWKVSYRSLIEFHCEIFNRSGQRIYGFDDPSDGWDGTWHGKKVKPGVYYYVITAKGADGQNYKKSGDINIINSVTYGNSSVEE